MLSGIYITDACDSVQKPRLAKHAFVTPQQSRKHKQSSHRDSVFIPLFFYIQTTIRTITSERTRDDTVGIPFPDDGCGETRHFRPLHTGCVRNKQHGSIGCEMFGLKL